MYREIRIPKHYCPSCKGETILVQIQQQVERPQFSIKVSCIPEVHTIHCDSKPDFRIVDATTVIADKLQLSKIVECLVNLFCEQEMSQASIETYYMPFAPSYEPYLP